MSANSDDIWKATVVAKVKPPTLEEAAKIENRAIVGIIQPRVNTELLDQLIKQKATVLSLDSLLRTVNDFSHTNLKCVIDLFVNSSFLGDKLLMYYLPKQMWLDIAQLLRQLIICRDRSQVR